MNIPEHHLEFCRAVAKLAASHNVEKFHIQFQPSYEDAWHSEIQMRWANGRHGEDSRNVSVTSTVVVLTKLKGAKHESDKL